MALPANWSEASETLCPVSMGNSTWLALVTLKEAFHGAPNSFFRPKVNKLVSKVALCGTTKSVVMSASLACMVATVARASVIAIVRPALAVCLALCLCRFGM